MLAGGGVLSICSQISLNMAAIHSIFVYGTLKQGQCREHCWPCKPLSVELATTRGALYDLGPYPALLHGKNHEEKVLGEIWTFRPADIADTLRVLDSIEGFGQGNVDLYTREIVHCRVEFGGLSKAYCYFLADPAAAADTQRLLPDVRGLCSWPGGD